jgi:hypothetical protein
MVGIIGLGIWLVLTIGWVFNIIHIAHDHAVVNGMFILRCVGIVFAPLGSVLGFL